jgi:hypothetical protein
MALRHLIQYLRTEHQALLNLATRLDKLLTSASKNDFAEHSKSLSALRSLDRGLLGVVRHCSQQDDDVESAYLHYLHQDARVRIADEHEHLIHAVTNFREELKCATPDRTMAMILPGMDVVNRLRAHIAYEQEMLGRIMELSVSPRPAVKKHEPRKKAHRKQKKHAVRRKPVAEEAATLPYTMELHPEL